MENTPVTLYAALAKAQASFHSALKDASNPFFKSKYADLSAIWESCKDALKDNGLVLMQPTFYLESAGQWVVNTRIYNATGDFVEGHTPILVSKQNDPQAFGSATTYARRYGASALLGIVTEDDDAEGAMSRDDKNTAKKAPVKAESPAPVRTENTLIATRAEYLKLLQSLHVSPEERNKAILNINVHTEEVLKTKMAKLNEIIEERIKKAA